ncbi:Aldolase-type TIM barrel [Moorella glycerini]|uniref:S-adenosyl-L-methionine-dependent 2-deoxy-scyllo-inosamine dehydrogenase n=1 Tax=Neomoorella stamsii TaxID=1266720 RepID=A0A9X7P5X1_9FIRM|nr:MULTISPECIES: radical SAM protein [Moorella]PRR72310.1 S-adenosyl-L-methionine-dependent 2-deoxy-scyllo-inosamine dehydrogenase [Moorella stamsii]CEP68879.1 Aldolase-type TIM barrel [Moorella glycerini]
MAINVTSVPVNPTYHEIVVNESVQEWERSKGPEYHEYRRKWALNPKHFVLEHTPIHLDIEPTNSCNLKCPMCPRTVLMHEGNNKLPVGFMDFNVYKEIIDQAASLGVSSIKLNWLGEPLLHPRIVDMVCYAKEKGIIDVMFNTNAVLLTEQVASELIDAGLDKLFFSFDSPFKEEYENIRVGANYERTLENIKALQLLKQKKGRKSPLTRVSMVLMQENHSSLEHFINLFSNIVDIVAYVDYRQPLNNRKESYNDKIAQSLPSFACSQLWQRMFIAWDGEVVVCCVDSEREFVVGNIRDNNIDEIWHNDKYKYMRECHMKGEYYRVNICSKCSLPAKNKDGSL